eukprot:scaffold1671_cov120-Skeletonema_dohrnii-CCMP3373.AAC.9
MVKLARIQKKSGRVVLAARIAATSFQSSSSNVTSDHQFHFVDLSAIASSARAFLLDSKGNIARANLLINNLTSPDAQLSEITKHVIFSSDVKRVLSPLDGGDVGKFICIGMNYVDHCDEQNLPVPEVPLVFSKFGSCIVGPDDGIPLYAPSSTAAVTHGGANASLDEECIVTSKLDYEVELGIVIGTTVPRFTKAADAHKYIAGYTVIHDVSARDMQLEANGGQWLLGKCCDGYAPLGPVITTLDEFCTNDDGFDEFAGAGNLHIECRLQQKGTDDFQVVQSSSTSNLVFSTPQIISYLSKFMTLKPGDVIATGTPPGVGCFRKPEPLWLNSGDVVEVEIEGIGVLRNSVVDRIEDNDCSTDKEVKNEYTEQQATVTKGPPPSISGIGSEQQLPKQQRLENTVCVVTGAARGIGNGIARRLALEGAVTVVLIDMNQDDLDEAASQLEQEVTEMMGDKGTSRPTFYGLACDVTNSEKVKDTMAFIAKALSTNGRIDVLVQAAGVVGKTNVLTHEVEEENFDFVMDVNVKGIFNGCKAVLPYMIEQNYGRIVNIASIAGKEGNVGMLSYSTSKAAVIGLTKTVGKEYALNGITCNAIAPAVIRTQMVADMPEKQVKYMTEKIPMKRCGTVEEIGALVAYVASEEAAFTTGFCFDATGGRSVY